jgi:hypothetical protein
VSFPKPSTGEIARRLGFGRCVSCACRDHECNGVCNCPRLECFDVQHPRPLGEQAMTPLISTQTTAPTQEVAVVLDGPEHMGGGSDC